MKTLLPVDTIKLIVLKRDAAPTEFEVQAWLYSILKQYGFDVRGEVCFKGQDFQCRFDLVMFDQEKPVRIIEVKASQIKHKKTLEETRQGRRYRMFGVPVTFIYGIHDAGEFVTLLLEGKLDG